MFPIQSISGRVLGFGGRILTNDKKANTLKPLEKTEIYIRVNCTEYFKPKQLSFKLNNCFLVRKDMDVIQFNQSGWWH
jgi:DNA primase